MSYESSAARIKIGALFDFKQPEESPNQDVIPPFELVFKQGLESGMIDRPVEIVFREAPASS